MAKVKILSGAVPTQEAIYKSDALPIKTNDGGKKTYHMKRAIVSLQRISENGKEVIFDIELRDGTFFRAEAHKKVVHEFTKYAGTVSANPFIVKEQTPKQAKIEEKFSQSIGVCLVILICYGLFSCSKDDGSPSSEPDQAPDGIEVVVLCKSAVKNSLKSPSTADFPWAVEAYQQGEFYIVDSYVDAQNSFGATIRSYYHCKMRYAGGGMNGWVLEDLKIDQ